MKHLKTLRLFIPLLLFVLPGCCQVTYQGNTGNSAIQLFCMVDSVDENTQVQFWQSVNTSTNQVLYLNDDFTTLYIPSGSIKTCTEVYSAEGLCFVEDTRSGILTSLSSSALTPGCRYCVTDVAILSGGQVCFTADGSNRLERQATWYPPGFSLGLDVIYDIATNQFDYLRDTMNNQAMGWPTIQKVYAAGIFNQIIHFDNTFEGIADVIATSSSLNLQNCYFGQGVTLDMSSASGTILNSNFDNGATIQLTGTSLVNLNKVNFGAGTSLNCQSAPGLNIEESDIFSESGILVADTSLLSMYSTTMTSEGKLNVTQASTCTISNSELTGFSTTNVGSGASATIRRLNNNSFSTLSINGAGASVTIVENCALSNTGTLSCTNSGVDVIRCRVDSRGFMAITDTEGDIENCTVSNYSNLFSAGNSATWSLSESNVMGGSILTINAQTGGTFAYLDLDTRAQGSFFGGSSNTVRYIRLSLASFFTAPLLTSRTLEYCYINGFLTKNLLDQDYVSKGADYFNDNY